MKKLYAAIMLVLPAFVLGCLKQDYSPCGVDDNLVLLFTLEDGNGDNVFSDKIETVDAVVFDENYNYVAHRNITAAQLEQFEGTAFTVMPGNYHVVCWANVSSGTSLPSFSGSTAFEECRIHTVSDESGCPLYYAPYKEITDRAESRAAHDYTLYSVNVPPEKVSTKNMRFVRAHRRVNVYVRNYNHTENPTVQITGMPVAYDFFLRTYPDRKDYATRAQTVSTTDGLLTLASFDAPVTGFAEGMDVNVKRSTDLVTTHSVNLKTYVEQNTDNITDINEIDILFDIGLDGEVTISMPDWATKPVAPEL